MKPATRRSIIALGLASTCGHFACKASAAAETDSTAITIYSSAMGGAIAPELYRPLPGASPDGMAVPGYAVVRQDRGVKLTSGRSTVRFTDVAALIDPTTVTFTSLTDPSTSVLEQNFQDRKSVV